MVLDKGTKTCYAHPTDTNLSGISDRLKGLQCMSDMLIGILGLICIIGIVVTLFGPGRGGYQGPHQGELHLRLGLLHPVHAGRSCLWHHAAVIRNASRQPYESLRFIKTSKSCVQKASNGRWLLEAFFHCAALMIACPSLLLYNRHISDA